MLLPKTPLSAYRFIAVSLLATTAGIPALGSLHEAQAQQGQATCPDLRGELRLLVARVADSEASMPGIYERLNANILLGGCAVSEDPCLKSDLRTLAETCPENFSLALPALDALWRLGEHRGYFAHLVEDYAAHPGLAASAALILARDPLDAEIERFREIVGLAEALELPHSGVIAHAALEARQVLRAREKLYSIAALDEQLDFICGIVAGGFAHLCIMSKCGVRHLTEGENVALFRFVPSEPRITWAQSELMRISGSHPSQAALALRNSLLDGRFVEGHSPEQREACIREARGWVSWSLVPASRAIYDHVSLAPGLLMH